MPDPFIILILRTLVAVFCAVAGAALEKFVVGLNIGGEVYNLASRKLFGGFENNRFAVMVGAFKATCQADPADVFAALCGVRGGDFIFGEDGGVWAFRDAGATIDAGVGVDINPRPFCNRLARDHTLDRAHLDTAAVTNA